MLVGSSRLAGRMCGSWGAEGAGVLWQLARTGWSCRAGGGVDRPAPGAYIEFRVWRPAGRTGGRLLRGRSNFFVPPKAQLNLRQQRRLAEADEVDRGSQRTYIERYGLSATRGLHRETRMQSAALAGKTSWPRWREPLGSARRPFQLPSDGSLPPRDTELEGLTANRG